MKNLYFDALRSVCDYKLERSEFESCLSYVTPACEMYPFDEWQSVKIDCYIGLNRHKDALKEYEATAKLFFEELGISPSEKMMNQFEKMSSNINYKPQDIKDIKDRLKEVEDESGAFYCTFPSFRDSYRLVTRIIERNGQSVYLMLLSLTNGKGQPLENEEKLEMMSQELHKAIKKALRRGDSFTKYSPSQLSPNGSYGYSGVVVVRAYDNNLYAFDICCTYEADRDVTLEDDGFFLTCPQCGSVFEIGNGTGFVNSGPATQRLKKYYTSQNSSQKIRIYN